MQLAAAAPDVVLASPLLRARETAAAIAIAADVEVRVDDRLAPGATAEDVLAAIEGAGDTVVTVGHQPDCSEVAVALGAGHDREFAARRRARDRAQLRSRSSRSHQSAFHSISSIP